MAITLTIKGAKHKLDVEPDMPLLWALRDDLNMTGTKFGYGVAARIASFLGFTNQK